MDCKIEPAPDEWDRKYNVDFYIKINEKCIGIQIKPINTNIQLPEIYKEKQIQKESHEEFMKKYGGAVFYVYSSKQNGDKVISNPEVIEQIEKEIKRLEF